MKPSTGTHLQLVQADRGTQAQKAPTLARLIEQTIEHLIDQATHAEAPDEIRPIAAWAKVWGLELAGLRGAIERAKVPTVRIGRSTCARRSDLLRIVDALLVEAPKPKATGDIAADYNAIVEQARAKRERKATR